MDNGSSSVERASGSGQRLERLRELVVNSLRAPYYARTLGDVDLQARDEFELLSRLPVLDRETAQSMATLHGPLACAPPEDFVRVHHTSGSAGAGSLWVFDTAEDWAAIVAAWEAALDLHEIGPQDRALVCASYGRFIGFWGLHEALIARGVMTVSGADLDTVGRANLIEQLGITVVAATPSYALLLGSEARRREHRVRMVLTSGEPRPAATRTRLQRAWGCDTADTAGMTEVGTITMVECPDQPGDLHVLDAVAIEEVLHPETREPVADGEMGVRVVTALTRRGMPFLRYWTQDLVVPAAPRCNCGLGARMYVGGIRGRLDDMVKVRGVWFLPSMLEEVVGGFPQIVEWRSRIAHDERGLTALEVEVELRTVEGETAERDFLAGLVAECKRQLGFRPDVRVAEQGSLPRPQGGKTARFERLDREPVGA